MIFRHFYQQRRYRYGTEFCRPHGELPRFGSNGFAEIFASEVMYPNHGTTSRYTACETLRKKNDQKENAYGEEFIDCKDKQA